VSASQRRASEHCRRRRTGKIATSEITRLSAENATFASLINRPGQKRHVPEFTLDDMPNADPPSSLIIDLRASAALLSMPIEKSKSVFN
jgi:hypothetical protein